MQLYARHCDVTKPESIVAVFNWIEVRFGGVNIIINNAGISRCTMVLAMENEHDLLDVMNTNFTGILLCIKAAYRLMKKYKVSDGHIVNINSIMGRIDNLGSSTNETPITNLFTSSKHAVTALTETIREELNYLHIKNIKISV